MLDTFIIIINEPKIAFGHPEMFCVPIGFFVVSLLVVQGNAAPETIIGENGEVYVAPPPQLSRSLQKKFPGSRKLHPALLPRKHQAALVHSIAVSSPTKENKDSVELDRTVEEELFLPEQDLAVPKLLNVDVRCNRNSLDVIMTFDAEFHGVVYSKGHYSDPNCRYLRTNPETGPNQLKFTVFADKCGTRLVDGGKNGEAFVENTVVVQNTAGIQAASDTARALRCRFERDNIARTVSSSLSVDVLDVISVTYSGDSIDSYMDVQLGKGPFHANPVNGPVKIGETLTMVVYIHGDDYDVHVADCIAHDGDVNNAIQLSNHHGCVSKPKVMGPWQRTRETLTTGASAIAWAYMEAFKFPDKLEVFLECNIEICKFQCHDDPNRCLVGRKKSAASRKRRSANDPSSGIPSNSTATLRRLKARVRKQKEIVQPVEAEPPEDPEPDTEEGEELAESAHLMRGIRVVAPEDSIETSTGPVRSSTFVAVPSADRPSVILAPHPQPNQLCVSTSGFLFCASLGVLLLVTLLLTIVGLYLRMRQLDPEVQLMTEAAMAGTMQRRHVIASISARAGQGAPRRKGDF
ncbi:uncharacterized protein LOC100900037 [Galendromus occidentalis]|uniref:Uncharacterized protein LOC100900037 n=1 Tax=Galendromus occidentalis TaxID=34638 RepID=A0AAJ7PAG4_9ACAR|nr:uncharacterized protein LOC100900037 [Galendromus occidentalis]